MTYARDARAIQLRDMAIKIVQPQGEQLSAGDGKVRRFVDDRLAISYKAPTESTYSLTVFWDLRHVLYLEWSDDTAPHVISYQPGDWERELQEIVPRRLD